MARCWTFGSGLHTWLLLYTTSPYLAIGIICFVLFSNAFVRIYAFFPSFLLIFGQLTDHLDQSYTLRVWLSHRIDKHIAVLPTIVAVCFCPVLGFWEEDEDYFAALQLALQRSTEGAVLSQLLTAMYAYRIYTSICWPSSPKLICGRAGRWPCLQMRAA